MSKLTVTGADSATEQNDVILNYLGRRATVRKSGIVLSSDLSEKAWERIGTGLRELANSSSWWLADWLIFGESAFGWQRYREAIDRTGLDYQTLRNYAWVARRFEQHRRHDNLSFAHHAEVTRLSPPEQDYWLRKAEQQKWSRNELRKAVRASVAEQNGECSSNSESGPEQRRVSRIAGPSSTGTDSASSTTLTIELSAGRLDHYSEVAAEHGLSVDEWATQVLDAVHRRSA